MYTIKFRTPFPEKVEKVLEATNTTYIHTDHCEIEIEYEEYNEIPKQLLPFLVHPDIPELTALIPENQS